MPSVTILQPEDNHALARVTVELAPSAKHQNLRNKSTRRQAPYRLIGNNVSRDIKPPEGISSYVVKETRLVATVYGIASVTSEDTHAAMTSEIMASSPLFPSVGQ